MPGYLYRTGAPFDVQLVIFGKDGTLLDSEAVRLPALKECTTAIAHTAGEPALLPALLKAGGWEDTDKGPTLAPDSVMACGTTLELAQRWIDTQPMVAAHWHEDAVALCAEMQEVKMRAHALARATCRTAARTARWQVLRHAALRDATSLGPVLRVLGELQQAPPPGSPEPQPYPQPRP